MPNLDTQFNGLEIEGHVPVVKFLLLLVCEVPKAVPLGAALSVKGNLCKEG